MSVRIANNAFGTLAASIAEGDLSLTLTTGQGSRFPSLGLEDYFFATLVNSSNLLEIIKVTAVNVDTLTIERGVDGTVARAYTLGDRVESRVNAGVLNAKIDTADAVAAFLGKTAVAADSAKLGNAPATAYVRLDIGGKWTLAANESGTGFATGPQIRELNLEGAQAQALAAAPKLPFHWGGVVASMFLLEPNGRISVRNAPGTDYENFVAKNLEASGTVTANGQVIAKTTAAAKIAFQDGNTIRGYAGADAAFCFRTINAANNLFTFSVDNLGNGTFQGNISGTSDERLKSNWKTLGPDFLRNLAGTQYGVYDRIDIKTTQVGVSAQSLRRTLPQAIEVDADSGLLRVAYGQAALVSVIELTNLVLEQQRQIDLLKRRIDDMGAL